MDRSLKRPEKRALRGDQGGSQWPILTVALFLAATAAAVATPNVASALEATKIMGWQTMTREMRHSKCRTCRPAVPDGNVRCDPDHTD
jgi:hypothetical protein